MLSRSDGIRRSGEVGDGDKRRILVAYGEWNVGINSTPGIPLPFVLDDNHNLPFKWIIANLVYRLTTAEVRPFAVAS